jgi:hypothetical protein
MKNFQLRADKLKEELSAASMLKMLSGKTSLEAMVGITTMNFVKRDELVREAIRAGFVPTDEQEERVKAIAASKTRGN